MAKVVRWSLVMFACMGVLAALSCQPVATSKMTPTRVREPLPELPPHQVDELFAAFNRGMGLMDQYQPLEAVKAFEEVVRLSPDWPTGRLNLGIALLNTESDEARARAEDELRRVIELEPNNAYAHFSLGLLLTFLKRPDEARPEFRRVLEIDPNDADAAYQLAILLAEDDPVEAIALLEHAIEQIPHHESAIYRLSTMLRRQGDSERATKLLTRFRELKTSGTGVAREFKYGEMGRYAMVARAFEPGVDASWSPEYQNVAREWGLTGKANGTPGRPGQAGASFGPGVACADIDCDGDFDVLIPGLSGGGLYRNGGGRFEQVRESGLNETGAIAAYFGDYDGDGDPDVFLTCHQTNRLFNNDGTGKFTDVTASAGVAGAATLSAGAAWADADHDGDLDIYVANYGAPNPLWRNNGDGTFTDVARMSSLYTGRGKSTSVAFFDVDQDRDLDLYVIYDGEPNQLFLNDRVGQYRDATERFPELVASGPWWGVSLGDVDGNGHEDLILQGSGGSTLFFNFGVGGFRRARGDSWSDAESHFLLSLVEKGQLADVDLDGDLDLLVIEHTGKEPERRYVRLSKSENFVGTGRAQSLAGLGERRPAVAPKSYRNRQARGSVVADFDGDGMVEFLIATVAGPPELWRADPPEGRNWLTVIPTPEGDDAATRINPEAVGTTVEIKTGRQLQVRTITSSSGYLGSPPPVAHFGLGNAPNVDYARLTWPDATLQGELEIAANQQWRIAKASRKPSSCPILFAWNGERFDFITDFLGVGGMGFFMEPGAYAPPDPTEDVLIPPHQLKVKDGRYLLRVAEPLEEVTYLDQLHLVAYDHPADWELYPDERFTGTEPLPTGKPHAVTKKLFPNAARDRDGNDVRDRVLRIDRVSFEPPKDKRFVGYAEDHWIELDFGKQLQSLPEGARAIMYLWGWVEYTYSHVNYAAYQAGLSMDIPSVEIPDGSGGWKVAIPGAGFPAGLPRMMTLDITDLPIRDHGKLRLRTNMEVFWDQIFVGVDVMDQRIKRHTLTPDVADLRYLGYPREYSPDGNDPTAYDYHRVDQGLPFKHLTGNFTRFGDVRELLRDVDDRFVVMARGEEIVLEFDATRLPPLPAGWARTIVMHADGYCKDMNLYTAHPDAVDPLPYHAMDNYPPEQSGHSSPEMQEYIKTWNTRQVVGHR